MYAGATENDPLLRATTIKYEQRYSHQGHVLKRSIFIYLFSLGLIFIFDIARLILRRDTYDPGNGNMLPQGIMVLLLAVFLLIFNRREKTTVLVVVYITVLVLFFFFSLAILPSFIKEILIDFDVLCPVLIGLTGLNAIICIYCISTAYRYLKFHRKFTKRKATLPAVLQSSPQNSRASATADGLVSVLFPSQELSTKAIQEQWEKFQQSRLYFPEKKPVPRPNVGPGGTRPNMVPPTGLPGQLTDQERRERFHRSPFFSVNNQTDATSNTNTSTNTNANPYAIPNMNPNPNPNSTPSTTPTPSPHPSPTRTRRSATKEKPVRPATTTNTTLTSSASTILPPLLPPASPPSFPPMPAPPPPPDAPAQPTQDTHHVSPTRKRPPLDRNPSFRYGAYLHEPTQFRAYADDTPHEYTRLTQGNRGDSYANILDGAAQTVDAGQSAPPHAHTEFESFGAQSDGEEEQGESARYSRAVYDAEPRIERRLSNTHLRGSTHQLINFAHLEPRVDADAQQEQTRPILKLAHITE